MTLSLSETRAIQQLAEYLYSFLPGQPHPFADQRISFAGIANERGLKNFWQGGSKLPSITNFLEKTLEFKREVFCSVILEIVRRGIKYRGNKGEPITRQEIEELNDLILRLNFKIPELWDKKFLEDLPSLNQQNVNEQEMKEKRVDQQKRKGLIEGLKQIEKLSPQERGYAFERFLNELFGIFNLNPNRPFRLVGEQIDGSLELDGETYLIEAKWQNKLSGLEDLLYFHGKIAGKSSWSRGIFISYGGFTKDALEAFAKGRPTNLITLSVQDLYFVLEGHEGSYLDLNEVIRMKVRHAAETGDIRVSVYDLIIRAGRRYAPK